MDDEDDRREDEEGMRGLTKIVVLLFSKKIIIEYIP
jgi:hypothetical protein